jgi:hypothetical protein
MSPKRGAYPREFRDEAIRMLRAGRDPHELSRELGVTPATLRVWLHVADGGRRSPDLSRDAVINAAVAAFTRLDDVIGAVRPSALDAPMLFASESIDAWRIKDAVAHVTHYKARAVHRLKGRANNARDGDLDGYWDPDEWAALEAADRVLPRLDERTRRRHGLNHLVYERWRDRSAREVLAWHRRVHEHVMSVLRDGPDEWFGPSGRLPRVAIGEFAHHLDTHLRDIRRALS